jgi:hypothetical protein
VHGLEGAKVQNPELLTRVNNSRKSKKNPDRMSGLFFGLLVGFG